MARFFLANWNIFRAPFFFSIAVYPFLGKDFIVIQILRLVFITTR